MHRLPFAAAAAALLCVGIATGPASGAPGQDAAYATAAHQGNLAEMAAGQDARAHASTDCVKEVGARLVKDHAKLDDELKTIATRLDISLPSGPTAAQQEQLKSVQAKAGSAAYDKAWLSAQESAHTATLKLIDKQLDQGRDTALVTAARKAQPIVQMHLDMVRGGSCHSM
ncbi:DUF4142 domain-containing protein [Streptomyces sp. NPDC091268]|uniref:DUF4142 domain-containing protein n=1 Tax=Streptomyces sp. NPDC091268 TaxID=3365979 RepID=UPI00381ECC53